MPIWEVSKSIVLALFLAVKKFPSTRHVTSRQLRHVGALRYDPNKNYAERLEHIAPLKTRLWHSIRVVFKKNLLRDYRLLSPQILLFFSVW